MNGNAVVHGSGVTAACCIQALAENSFALAAPQTRQIAVGGTLLLSESTQALLCELFREPALFRNVPAIRKRIVAWGDGSSSVTLPHSAVMISENDLLVRLRQASHPVLCEPTETAWQVFCARGPGSTEAGQPIGSRTATFSKVTLSAGTEREACWMESVDGGWLFLMAAETESGWLIACGEAAEVLLGQSRLIAPQIDSIGATSVPVATSPRIADCLGEPGWLACGTAAMMFDPVCGEGTGNAVREAILASAVVEAAARGEDVSALLQHYRSRLTLGFLRHLHLCAQFYGTGGTSPFWQEQMQATQRGIAMIAQRIQDLPPPVFRLRGFLLERLGN